MIIDKQWIVGFTDGEGCFHIGMSKNDKMKTGVQILPEFVITQHEKSIHVLYALKTFFGCGVVRLNNQHKDGKIFCYRVRKFEHLKNIIVPFFLKNSLKTCKNVMFKKFRRVVQMMEKNLHLTTDGIKSIKTIHDSMNRIHCNSFKIEST